MTFPHIPKLILCLHQKHLPCSHCSETFVIMITQKSSESSVLSALYFSKKPKYCFPVILLHFRFSSPFLFRSGDCAESNIETMNLCRGCEKTFLKYKHYIQISATRYLSKNKDGYTPPPAAEILHDAQSLPPTNEDIEFPSDVTDQIPSDKEYLDWLRDQEKHSYRPKVDPRDTSILLFPGQGSQFVGMASSLLQYPNVPKMFNVAKSILGYDLLDVCINGPQAKLNRTVYSQPAILVTSLAAVERLREENPKVIYNTC